MFKQTYNALTYFINTYMANQLLKYFVLLACTLLQTYFLHIQHKCGTTYKE